MSDTESPVKSPPIGDPSHKGCEVAGTNLLLFTICEWREARAEYQRAVALHDKATAFGSLDDDDVPNGSDELDKVRSMDETLSTAVPKTLLEARELLRAALEVMAWHLIDPEHLMAEGPVLAIMRSVVNSLDHANGDVPCDPSGDKWSGGASRLVGRDNGNGRAFARAG